MEYRIFNEFKNLIDIKLEVQYSYITKIKDTLDK